MTNWEKDINFNEIKLNEGNYVNIFGRVPDNVVICINKTTNKNKILPQIIQKKCYKIYCSDDWNSKQQKKINSVNNCECELDNCLSCPSNDSNKKVCTQCSKGFYRIENDNSNMNEYFNCYKELKGYYLDKNVSLFKKCYDTCETCEIKGDNINHNCVKCNENYPIEININNYSNCYENCKYYYYFDNESYYHCTVNLSCPDEYPILNKNKSECIKGDIYKYETSEIIYEVYTTIEIEEEKEKTTSMIYETEKIEKTDKIMNINNINDMIQDLSIKYKNDSSKEKTNEEEKKYYNAVIKNIESIFTDKNFDTTNLDNGGEQVIKTEKITITLTTSQSQKNKTNDYNNMTILDLGDCEKDLRESYNISNDKLLYIKKMDVVQEGMKISKIEYSVYCKLNDINLVKLNLSVCENSKISLSVPIEIKENLDKLNTSSDYFNNICYSSKSDKGTDISLKDRKKEFVENNKTVCQEDCLFADYNKTTLKANCSCLVKESSDDYENMNINKTKLYESFGDIHDKTEISNLGITSCNVLSSIKEKGESVSRPIIIWLERIGRIE